MKIKIIGNSHTAALRHALNGDETARARWQAAGLDPVILAMTLKGEAPFQRPRQGARRKLHPEVAALLEGFEDDADAVVSLIGGNAHNILGLVELDPPLELFDPADPPLLPGRALQPRTLAAAAMRRRIGHWAMLMRVVRRRLGPGRRMIHVCPPPPVGDEAHIRQHPSSFAEAIETQGIAPLSVRMKFWRLHVELLQEICAEADIEFLPPPSQGLDARGALRADHTVRDPFHGNPRYGALVAEQLAESFTGALVA